MGVMFSDCSSLQSLDLSHFDTSSVTYMGDMFARCSSLQSLDLSSFDTSEVTDMAGMFARCSSLKSLDLSSFDTSKMPFLNVMFYGCSSLKSLDLSAKMKLYSDCGLPDVPSDDGVHDGKWTLVGNPSIKWSTSELESEFPSTEAPAGTWVWSLKNPVKVQFDANGGDGSMSSYTINSDLIYLPDCGFYKSGYTFTGWNTQADGKGTMYQAGDLFDTQGKDTTLYAQWKESNNKAQITNGHFTVTIKAGQKITIKGLPGGATYTVHERNRAGWVLQSSKNATGVIPALGVAQSKFTNKYDSKATSVDLSATKTLDGKAPKDRAYSFTLTPSTVGAPMPGNATGSVTVSNVGSLVDFGHIVFSKSGTYYYTMTEVTGTDSTINYDTHQVKATVEVTNPTGTGALVARVTYTGGDAFSNTTKTGSLTVSKQVSGTSDTSKEFNFSVSLLDAQSQALTGKYGDVSVTNGKGTFTLKAGQSKQLTNLPAGTQYQVEEVNVPDGYVSSSSNASGTIAAAGSATASFTNTYSASSTSVYLTATKTLSGGTLQDKEFSFELKDKDGKVLQTSQNDATGNIAFDGIELASAGSYSYFVDEMKPSDADANIQYSDEAYEYEVTVTDNGAGQLQNAVQVWSVDPATHSKKQKVDAASFTNAVKTGTVSLTKKVEGTEAQGKTFGFQVKLTDASGAVLDGSYNWTSTSTGSDGKQLTGTVKSGDTLQLSKDETVTISGLPAGSKYEFTEDEATGYTQTSAQNLSGTIKADDTVAATATNTYAASGTAQVKAKKVVLRSGQETTPTNGAFSFTLAGKSDGSKDNSDASFDTPVALATNDSEGNVTFRKLVYTAKDAGQGQPFVYQIQEVDDGNEGYDFDHSKYLAKVTPTDKGDGTIECKVEYSTDSGKTWTENVPTFKNDTVTRMPVAGASGFAGIVAAGGALLVLSAVAWLRRKRREA